MYEGEWSEATQDNQLSRSGEVLHTCNSVYVLVFFRTNLFGVRISQMMLDSDFVYLYIDCYQEERSQELSMSECNIS